MDDYFFSGKREIGTDGISRLLNARVADGAYREVQMTHVTAIH